MKKIWIIAGVIGIAVLALGTGGLAYAQTETPQLFMNPDYEGGMRGGRGGFGGMRADMLTADDGLYHEYMYDGFAELFGLSVDEIETRIESGETMWQIAEAVGVTMEEFGEIMAQVRTERFDQAIAEGVITQEKAEFMDQRMSQWQDGDFGSGYEDCMGDGTYESFNRAPQGRWNAP